MKCTAEKVSVFGAKPVCSASRAARPDLAFPSRGRLTVGFCFADRDFVTASEPTRFSFSEKEKLRKRKTAQGTAPRSEPRVATANRDEVKSRGSMRLRPPRPPKERVRPVAAATGAMCTAENVAVFGAKDVRSRSALHLIRRH